MGSEILFREASPSRKYDGKELKDYKGYKEYLSKDFNSRCGYTNCFDFWFGGKGNFQIDHFKPKSKFPDLETKYSNLVYSCSHINRAKSNDDGLYIDPCDVNYNDHFYRDELGNIYPKETSEAAKYMYKSLKLYLKRYSIIWMIDQLEGRMFKLQEIIQKSGNQEAKDLLIEITFIYNNYKKYLRAI